MKTQSVPFNIQTVHGTAVRAVATFIAEDLIGRIPRGHILV